MGIPHLIAYLRPYAESKSLAGQDIIIDGPGLCYLIHHRCLGRRIGARDPFGAAPSYQELGSAAIEWLDGLRDSGAVVQKIYFDGFLPSGKLKTRLERLQKLTKQLIDYHSTHSDPCRGPLLSYRNENQPVFERQSPRPSPTSFPAPPFLVPAILEALKTSRHYDDMTAVIPGEADLFCARYVKTHGGVVLTGDSDLLLHDLGSEGAVSFFNDVQLSADEQPGHLQTLLYQPSAIAERLSLPESPGLLSLAFEMFMDTHGAFPKLLAQAIDSKAIKASGILYEDFCEEYIIGSQEPQLMPPGSCKFKSLDPRISEIVLQFPLLAKLAGQDTISRDPSQNVLQVYLPFLLDCPVRTSAWDISTTMRQLAYGLLNLMVPEDQQSVTATEHRRQQRTATTREWQLPSLSEIPDACLAILNRLTVLEDMGVATAELWLTAAICQELEWSSSLDKIPLSPVAVRDFSDFQGPKKNCTWNVVHFVAQIQGSYYSFRILKQILGVVLAHRDTSLYSKYVLQLRNRLESLPGLCEDLTVTFSKPLFQRVENGYLLKIAYKAVGIEEPAPVATDERFVNVPRNKRKRKGLTDTDGPIITKTKSTNPYDLLQED